MKEFIDKLISRLEGLKIANSGCNSTTCEKCQYENICSDGEQSFKVTVDNAIEIVIELAEEYNNESVKGDLISRSALIEAINEQVKGWGKKGIMPSLFSAVAIVQNQPTACNDDWIPCEKQLPPQPKENPLFENKPLELYLASVKGSEYPWRVFWNGKSFTDGWSKVDVLAWMELPKLYQPKGE